MRRGDIVWAIQGLEPVELSQLAHALVDIRPYTAKQLALHLLAHAMDDDEAQSTAGSLINSAIADIAMTVKAEVKSKPRKRKIVKDKEAKSSKPVAVPDAFTVNPFLSQKWGSNHD